MEFDVCPLRRNGTILPLWQRNHGAVRGRLYVEFEHDDELMRPIKVARVRRAAGGEPLLPPLYDAELVSCKPDWWTMTGYERCEGPTDKPVRYQQSWLLIPAEYGDRERAHGLAATPPTRGST